MEKKLEGHLVGFGTLIDWDRYEDLIWLGGAMSYRKPYSEYDIIPSKEECDQICANLSGEVVVSKIKRP